MAKHTQTIRRQIVDELFPCVCQFNKLALKGVAESLVLHMSQNLRTEKNTV